MFLLGLIPKLYKKKNRFFDSKKNITFGFTIFTNIFVMFELTDIGLLDDNY